MPDSFPRDAKERAILRLIIFTLHRDGDVRQGLHERAGAFGTLIYACGLGRDHTPAKRAFLAEAIAEMEALGVITREFTPGKKQQRAIAIKLVRNHKLVSGVVDYGRMAEGDRKTILDLYPG